MDDISDLGKQYETIRNSSAKISRSDLRGATDDFIKNNVKKTTNLTTEDRAAIKKALSYIDEKDAIMTPEDALSLRKQLDSLIDWKSEATSDGKRLIR
jgi:hypothetical protein